MSCPTRIGVLGGLICIQHHCATQSAEHTRAIHDTIILAQHIDKSFGKITMGLALPVRIGPSHTGAGYE
jgi:hypothetical protein